MDTVDGWPHGQGDCQSCPCGPRVVRVPHSGVWRRREDSFLGMELGLELLPRKEAGVGVGGRGGDRGREPQKRLQHSHTSSLSVPGSWNAGSLCSSQLWHEFPTTYPGKKRSGASLRPVLLRALSDGSRRLIKMGLSTVPLARSPRWGKKYQLGLPHGATAASISGIPAVRWDPPGPPKLQHPLPQGWGSSS